MTFGESIKTCFKQYATLSGRASRSEYWWFVLFTILLTLGGGIVNDALGGLLGLATLLPSLAVLVRRLHDTDKSGWWVLIGLIPFIGALVLLFFLVQASTEGANDYGAHPEFTEVSQA